MSPESLVVRMATSILTSNTKQARLDRNPTTSKQPPTNSAPETQYVISRGNGILAAAKVSYMTFVRLATNSLFPPEMAKNTPNATRTNKIAHGSRFASPSSPNRIKRSHSITLHLCGNLHQAYPAYCPFEHLIAALNGDPSGTHSKAKLRNCARTGFFPSIRSDGS